MSEQLHPTGNHEFYVLKTGYIHQHMFYIWQIELTHWILRYGWRCWRYCDVMIWKRFPHYWPFVRKIRWPPVDSTNKGPVMGRKNNQLKSVHLPVIWEVMMLMWCHCSGIVACYRVHVPPLTGNICIPEASLSLRLSIYQVDFIVIIIINLIRLIMIVFVDIKIHQKAAWVDLTNAYQILTVYGFVLLRK